MKHTTDDATITLPQKLYKFRALETKEACLRICSILVKNKLYGASPKSFNDPFDCRIPPRGNLEPHFARYLICPSNQSAETGPLSQAENDQLELALQKAQDRIDANGVLSLAASRDSTLMWSHYASDHRGVALEFDTAKWCDQHPYMKKQFFPVSYSQTRIALDLTRADYDDGQFFDSTILTKDCCWESEKEWRIIRRSPGLIEFPASALTGVIFGCRTPEITKTVLRRICRKLPEVAFYQAEVRTQSFGLDFKPC